MPSNHSLRMKSSDSFTSPCPCDGGPTSLIVVRVCILPHWSPWRPTWSTRNSRLMHIARSFLGTTLESPTTKAGTPTGDIATITTLTRRDHSQIPIPLMRIPTRRNKNDWAMTTTAPSMGQYTNGVYVTKINMVTILDSFVQIRTQPLLISLIEVIVTLIQCMPVLQR